MGSTGIQWSGTSGHLRIGIDVRWDDYNADTTAIQVWVDYYVQTQAWGYNDGQSLNIGGSISHRHDYNLSSPSGQTVTHHLYTYAIGYQGLSYSGGPTYTFTGSISGAYDGSAPSLGINWTLPARPANVPTAPPTSVDSVTSSSARIVVQAADGRGSGIVEYQVLVGTNAGDIIGSQVRNFSGGTGTVTGLNAATTYHAVSRARNGVGWGPWSSTASFTTGATVPGTPTNVSNSAVGQTDATVSFTAPANGGSAIQNYTIQIAKDANFSVDAATGTHAGSPIVLSGLVPGTAYWARVRANNGVGAGAWSTATSFSTLAGTPTITQPVEGQTKVTTAGHAYVKISALGITAGRTITAEFSKSSTFASGVITLTQNPSGKSSDDTYTLSDTSQYLSNGTWYVRAKVTNTGTGYVTPWSTTISFVESHTPSASAVSPTAGATIQYAATIAFFWRFNDAAGSADAQTAYRLTIENNVTGASVYDSGKTALAGNTTDPIGVSVAIAAAQKNVQLRWRVMVWDKGDVPSAWTGYNLFILADAPAVTVVTPAPSLPVDNGAPTFSWTNNIPSGGTQVAAVVKVYDQLTGETVWTGTVAGSRTNVSPDVVILTNARNYNFTIDVTDSTGLTGTTSGTFLTSYAAPPSIAYSVAADDPDNLGYIAVTWTNANPDDTFTSWKVYRRNVLTSSGWELLATIPDQNVREYDDYLLNAGSTYSYSVTQTAVRSGVQLESSVGYYLTGTDIETTEARTFSVELTQYWLINPDNQDQSVMLPNVTSDDSTLEFETATYNIIGRGRHRDYGDELGYSGTLTCQVRQPERRSSFRARMEELRRSNETYYLRTPFGRLFKVALGNLGWSPMAGTGTMEMGDMSIPYEEVA